MIAMNESNNYHSANLHELSVFEIIKLMNEEDKKVAYIVEKALPQIKEAIDLMVKAIEKRGKVIYFGAGTSGRLGVLDASECPPTFGVGKDLIQGIIAGGDTALRDAIENAEDSSEAGKNDVKKHVSEDDVVIGIASSGTTPYVLGAIEQANRMGVQTIGISCNIETELSSSANLSIELPTGAEAVIGSTRLKAGTAQKMVLNMLSTATMIKTGKVYKNLMVNVQATNNKLRDRAIEIIQEITGVDEHTAKVSNERANGDVRIAVLILLFNVEVNIAISTIDKHKGNFVKALNELSKLK